MDDSSLLNLTFQSRLGCCWIITTLTPPDYDLLEIAWLRLCQPAQQPKPKSQLNHLDIASSLSQVMTFALFLVYVELNCHAYIVSNTHTQHIVFIHVWPFPFLEIICR